MSLESLAQLDIESLTGKRQGPYNSFNPVSRVQIWQWCSAIGDKNPLYLDADYRSAAGYDTVIAPPAMMQMWTMRDVNFEAAPGSTSASPFEVFDIMNAHGITGNVAVSYDINFFHLLKEGDRAHHYTTVVAISPLKKTAIGTGHFVTERAEYLDQNERLFAEAFITYFQYLPVETPTDSDAPAAAEEDTTNAPASENSQDAHWVSDFSDVHFGTLKEGQSLPELVIPITHKLIVSTAIATQDFMPVHHNAPAAKAAGMPDIFMNILTTSGFCARYMTDWAGPASRVKKLSFKLQAPNTPGDTMVMNGRIKQLERQEDEALATIEFAGTNSLGTHVVGETVVAVADNY